MLTAKQIIEQNKDLTQIHTDRPNQLHFRRKDGSLLIEHYNDEPSMTRQADAQSADINFIVSRYNQTGQLPNQHEGIYGDFSNIPSYTDALNTIIQAEETFMSLNSTIRTKFGNDPQKYLDFLADPKNLEESYTLGLRIKPEESSSTTLQNINKSINELNETTKKSKSTQSS